MSHNAVSARAFLEQAASLLADLSYRRVSEHSKITDAMDRAIDRAQDRADELV
jgi:uncharacterized protein YggE